VEFSVNTVIKFKHCAVFADLTQSEMVLGATPHAGHHSLLVSYLLNLWRGPGAVREIIVADIRAAIDLGASKRAADLLIVLRLFLSDHPEGRIIKYSRDQGCVEVISLNRRRRQAGAAFPGRTDSDGFVQRPHTARHELNRHRDHFVRARQTLSLPKMRKPDNF
jgi:hypothetical protein